MPGGGDTLLDRVTNHRPQYAAAMREVEAAIRDQTVLEPEILELCRLRIAQLLRAGAEAEPVHADPVKVEGLAHWPTAPVFGARERLCIGYAEQVLLDAQGVSDDQAAAVIAAVGEGGFLVLTYACGFFETTSRARILLSGRKGP